ncbi:cysteine hydrolase family protein [Rhizobium sp. L1K21]|uniref:cysteine hydrolase family protein n=1 Tax=Rhizobium sp. L1K21 TaxID=2954933 RepID=UPI002091E84C|nr:isochorismatase family cysteine hydrolase [Rhizobium sp. L1K21]MCO6188641.1 cysteine hydrolase [Rhizobium sp. L1K21]
MTMFWPYSQPEDADKVALVVIDMQVDFCAPGGWVDQLGEDIANTRAVIPAVARALQLARDAGMAVFHTREGHLPDLSDLPANKQWRTRVHGLGIGDEGACGRILVRGEPGFQIVPELAPLKGEVVIDKPGKSAFHATDFDQQLKSAGISHLVITGVTSDCCVQSTFRDGYERGYECVILEDCTAAVEHRNHAATMDILKAYGGRWGTVSNLTGFQQAIEAIHA